MTTKSFLQTQNDSYRSKIGNLRNRASGISGRVEILRDIAALPERASRREGEADKNRRKADVMPTTERAGKRKMLNLNVRANGFR